MLAAAHGGAPPLARLRVADPLAAQVCPGGVVARSDLSAPEAAADAVSRLEHQHIQALLVQLGGGREARHARSDDDDVDRLRRCSGMHGRGGGARLQREGGGRDGIGRGACGSSCRLGPLRSPWLPSIGPSDPQASPGPAVAQAGFRSGHRAAAAPLCRRCSAFHTDQQRAAHHCEEGCAPQALTEARHAAGSWRLCASSGQASWRWRSGRGLRSRRLQPTARGSERGLWALDGMSRSAAGVAAGSRAMLPQAGGSWRCSLARSSTVRCLRSLEERQGPRQGHERGSHSRTEYPGCCLSP